MKKFLFLICALCICLPVFGKTTNWYVDGSVYDTTTCSSGDDVTPPTAPAKHGYTFIGWYDTDVTAGTWFRTGVPTHDNPIYPTFYQDGDLILRAVGSGTDSVIDTYNQTNGKITRRVGIVILKGTEGWAVESTTYYTWFNKRYGPIPFLCSHFNRLMFYQTTNVGFYIEDMPSTISSLSDWKQWLADQYAAGTPVTIYYPLEPSIEETYTPSNP